MAQREFDGNASQFGTRIHTAQQRRGHLEFAGDTHQLATRVTRGLHRAIKLAAFEAEVRLNTWVADALATHLARVTGKPVTDTHQNAPKTTPVPLARRARPVT